MTTQHIIVEPGRIVAIDAAGVLIETQRNSTCSSCSAQKACGHGILNTQSGRPNQRTLIPLNAAQRSQYRIDEAVELTIDERLLVRAALLMYLLPLLGLLLGASLAATLAPGDISAAFGALAGFVLALYGVRRSTIAKENEASFSPRVRSLS